MSPWTCFRSLEILPLSPRLKRMLGTPCEWKSDKGENNGENNGENEGENKGKNDCKENNKSRGGRESKSLNFDKR